MIDLAYMGGFFDGEGCIGIYRTGGPDSKRYRLTCHVVQNNSPIVYAMFSDWQVRWGGCLKYRTRDKHSGVALKQRRCPTVPSGRVTSPAYQKAAGSRSYSVA
jgi:hypothetical protein